MSLKLTPAAPVDLDMKIGMLKNDLMQLSANLSISQQTARHPHILVAICTAIMMMLSAHCSSIV